MKPHLGFRFQRTRIIAGSKHCPRHCTIKLQSAIGIRMISFNQLGAHEIPLSATWCFTNWLCIRNINVHYAVIHTYINSIVIKMKCVELLDYTATVSMDATVSLASYFALTYIIILKKIISLEQTKVISDAKNSLSVCKYEGQRYVWVICKRF